MSTTREQSARAPVGFDIESLVNAIVGEAAERVAPAGRYTLEWTEDGASKSRLQRHRRQREPERDGRLPGDGRGVHQGESCVRCFRELLEMTQAVGLLDENGQDKAS